MGKAKRAHHRLINVGTARPFDKLSSAPLPIYEPWRRRKG